MVTPRIIVDVDGHRRLLPVGDFVRDVLPDLLREAASADVAVDVDPEELAAFDEGLTNLLSQCVGDTPDLVDDVGALVTEVDHPRVWRALVEALVSSSADEASLRWADRAAARLGDPAVAVAVAQVQVQVQTASLNDAPAASLVAVQVPARWWDPEVASTSASMSASGPTVLVTPFGLSPTLRPGDAGFVHALLLALVDALVEAPTKSTRVDGVTAAMLLVVADRRRLLSPTGPWDLPHLLQLVTSSTPRHKGPANESAPLPHLLTGTASRSAQGLWLHLSLLDGANGASRLESTIGPFATTSVAEILPGLCERVRRGVTAHRSRAAQAARRLSSSPSAVESDGFAAARARLLMPFLATTGVVSSTALVGVAEMLCGIPDLLDAGRSPSSSSSSSSLLPLPLRMALASAAVGNTHGYRCAPALMARTLKLLDPSEAAGEDPDKEAGETGFRASTLQGLRQALTPR